MGLLAMAGPGEGGGWMLHFFLSCPSAQGQLATEAPWVPSVLANAATRRPRPCACTVDAPLRDCGVASVVHHLTSLPAVRRREVQALCGVRGDPGDGRLACGQHHSGRAAAREGVSSRTTCLGAALACPSEPDGAPVAPGATAAARGRAGDERPGVEKAWRGWWGR